MDKILIIEDDINEFHRTSRYIKQTQMYDIIPSSDDKVEEMIRTLKCGCQNDHTTSKQYIANILTSNWKDIKVIICDMRIEGYTDNVPQGVHYIKHIRQLSIREALSYAERIPIIAYSHYANQPEIKDAMEFGVINIKKDENPFFPYIVPYLAKTFDYVMKGLRTDDSLELMKEKLEELKRGQIFIANAIFSGLTDSQKRKINDEFNKEMKELIPPDKLSQLNENFWERAETLLRDFNQSGGFTNLIEGVENMVNDYGLCTSGQGKVIFVFLKFITHTLENIGKI